MKKFLPVLPLALLLAACGPRVPTVLGGSLELYQGGKIVTVRQLTNPEVMAFAEWFMATPDGWKPTRATYAPVTVVRLRHADNEESILNLLPATAVLRNASGQFEKTLAPEEAANLRAIIADRKSPAGSAGAAARH